MQNGVLRLVAWISRPGMSVAICAGLAIAGCAKPPKPTSFNNSESYSAPFDAVWGATVEFMARHNIPIKTIEKESGIVYAEPANASMGFADCGESIANVIMRPATLNIFIRENEGATSVTVNTTFKEIRSFDGQTFTQECYSTGVLEREILSAIRLEVGSPSQ